MSRHTTDHVTGVLDDEGNPPHGSECNTCRMFSAQKAGECSADWGRRLFGEADTSAAVAEVRDRQWPGLTDPLGVDDE